MKRIALLALSLIILCTACAVHASEEDIPMFTSILDALDSTEGYAEVRNYGEDAVLIAETNGRYFRIFTLLDDHAKELYKAAAAEDCKISLWEPFNEYAWSLPLSYMEELPDPLSRAELDCLKGKTVQQLMDEGFGKEILVSPSELASPAAIDLEYGFYKYQFEVTEASSGYRDMMRIMSGKFDGLSRDAFVIDIPEYISEQK